MVLSLIAEATLKAVWWTLYQVYASLYRVCYGQWPPTPETKVNQKLDQIKAENRDLLRKIDQLENLIRNKTKETPLSDNNASSDSEPDSKPDSDT